MFRLPPWILIVAVWAAIYLPALGSFEIKGEEGRRILPAMAMLESGNYLIPQVGSDTYFSKPPLINWLVAGSFKITGIRSEWTARLPSVLAILSVAIAFITVGRAALGAAGSTIAALIWLTTIGIIEKGRLIEIEAVYVSLLAIAMICWLSWLLGNRSPWLTWTVPWIWLGLGWLAKGPVHLIFFYAVVFAVLWQKKQLKALLHPAHFLGIAIMLGIFAAWAIPFLQTSERSRALTKWSGQFTGRVNPNSFSVGAALYTLGRAVGQFLPWLIFVPLVRFNRFDQPNDKLLTKGLAWSVIVPLVVISLLPISAPRYSLPVAAPFSWFLALAFAQDAFVPLPWLTGPGRTMWQRLGLPIAVIVAVLSFVVFSALPRVLRPRNPVKSVAEEVNRLVPETDTLYAIDPGYQPFLFYVRAPVKYIDQLANLPGSARYFFVRAKREGEVAPSENGLAPPRTVQLRRLTDYRNETIVIFKVDGE